MSVRSTFWFSISPDIPATATANLQALSEADPTVCPHCGYVNHPEANVREDGRRVCNRCYLTWHTKEET